MSHVAFVFGCDKVSEVFEITIFLGLKWIIMLTYSFEDLAQTYRVLLESNFKLQQLMAVDRAEAIGTLETAIKMHFITCMI